jgi:hypothetical protein
VKNNIFKKEGHPGGTSEKKRENSTPYPFFF